MPGIAGGGVSAIAPILLTPISTLSAKRAARMEALQLTSMLAQESERKLSVLKAQDNALQADFAAIGNLDVLPPGRQRIQENLAAPVKAEIAERIKTQYGGNYQAFVNAEGDYYGNKIKEGVRSNPVVQRELQNKVNYGLIQKDRMDGKIIRPGAMRSFLAYQNGQSDSILYDGAIEPPKDLQEDFQKTYGKSGPYGVIDYRTGAQQAEGVSRADVMARLQSDGYSPADAKYLVEDVMNYKDGQWQYKADPLKPGWLEDIQGKRSDRALNRERFNETRYQGRQRLNIAWANVGLAKERINVTKQAQKDKKEKETKPFANDDFYKQVFSTDGTPVRPGSKTLTLPVLQKGYQQTVQEWSGFKGAKADVPDQYGTNVKKDVYELIPDRTTKLYKIEGNGTFRPVTATELNKSRSANGSVRFKNVDFSKVYKIPDRSGKGYHLAVKAVGVDGDYYKELSQDELTMRQVRTNSANKAEVPTGAQERASGVPVAPMDDTNPDIDF